MDRSLRESSRCHERCDFGALSPAKKRELGAPNNFGLGLAIVAERLREAAPPAMMRDAMRAASDPDLPSSRQKGIA
jgi:hypothetical protein